MYDRIMCRYNILMHVYMYVYSYITITNNVYMYEDITYIVQYIYKYDCTRQIVDEHNKIEGTRV